MLSLDFLYIVVPFILYTTVLADWTYINTTIVALLVLLCILAGRFGSFFQEDGVQSLRQNISSYRVSLMLLTCLCILAVDFKIFPRRYAKTETYGTSLMDLGVGSFVLANSLVSRQARGISTLKISNSLRSASPLIFLGFARLISTSSVDYQVHVGEYGVHWNFFFTLAGVAILTSIINVPPNYCGILGLLILLGYQVLLLLGLNEYLLSDKRGADLISQNKEGIFSIFGYWSLYLVGVQLGNFLFFENHANSSLRTNKWARIRVWVLSLSFWLLTYILDRHVERVSRRMCNLAYVTLVLAQNLQVLGIIMLSRHKLSALEEAFDQNLLASFLLANVLTGLVNLSVDTLFVSSVSALAILQVYAFVLSLAVGFAKFYGIKFKFW
nr:GWT1 protein [Ipomoea batatas]